MGKVKKTPDDEILHPHEILRQNLKKSSNKITTKNGKVKKKVSKQFTSYKCKFCNKKFTDKYNCSNHEKLHSSDCFPCPDCPYKGKTKKYLARHRKQVHERPAFTHKCTVCGKMFDYLCNLKEHVMVHTGEKPHKCEVCGKAFRVTFSLNNHMLIHTNEKPYKCSVCKYSCRDNSTLRKHENRHKGIVKTFSCKICPRKFPGKAKLKYHISEVHLDYLDLDLRRHNCDKCGKNFKCKYVLNKHIQVVHEKLLTCNCPICGQLLSNKNNLPAHLRTHFNERPYACTHLNCHKRFKDKSALKKHAIIHSPHLHHPCQVCGALFSRAHRLASHMKMHNPRDKCAECDYCGVSFYSKNYLIKHITKKHTDNKEKFTCDLCGLVTFNKPSIVMHLKYGHGNEKDIRCKICKTKYKRFIYLKAHYLKTHNMRYKTVQHKKKDKPSVEVKVEPMDEPYGEVKLQLLEVHKQEIVDEDDPDPENDYLTYSKHVLSEDLAECILNKRDKPENQFEEFLFDHVFHKQAKEEDTPTGKTLDKVTINEEQREEVTQKIKDIIKKAQATEAEKLLERRKKKEAKLLAKKLRREAKMMRKRRRQEIYELERVRQMYNERMRAAADEGKKKEPVKTIKYFKQKTSEKTCSNNNDHKENSGDVNDDCLSNKDVSNHINDSLNDRKDPSNDTNEDKVANSDENLANNARSDDTNENGTLLNAIHGRRTDDIHDSDDEMLSSLSTDKNTKTIETVNHDRNNDTSKVTNDSLNDKNNCVNANSNEGKGDDSNTENFTINNPDLNDTKNANHNDENKDDSTNDKNKDSSINDENKDDSISDEDNDDKSDNDSNYEPNSSEDEPTVNKRLKFKTYQCYVCFKLYPTKEELISHCQSHFDICNTTTLAKCPVCAHVASANIAKHMLKKHGMKVKIPYNRITDRKDNAEGSRYCYKMDDKGTVMEIIPSVKILNHHASVAIDKKNRERREKTIAKTRLVKKGKEWVVENFTVQISYNELPEFTEQELSKLTVSNSYADRLGQLSRLAKKKGVKMVFPCDACDKICQNFSALRLHGRRHDPHKKPFAPKKYKRNAKPAPARDKPEVSLENRLAKPQPIIHKHKCDEKLKKFYETHIRGADIEFWQFLKIYNKMDRENIRDFKDFEGRTEFGIHTNEDRAFNDPKTAELGEKSLSNTKQIRKFVGHRNSNQSVESRTLPTSKLLKNVIIKPKVTKLSPFTAKGKEPVYKRVIMISRKERLEREKVKMSLRESLAKRNV